jgi:hypothetical protein
LYRYILEATKKFGDEAVAGVLADKLDLNGDGQIDFAEFCAGFAKIDMNKKLAVNALAVAAVGRCTLTPPDP